MRYVSDEDYKKIVEYEKLNKDYNDLLNLVARVLPNEGEIGDKRISRKDFCELHDFMVGQIENVKDDFTKENNAIYGHNITVHWHGLYCDCYDGATPANHIIPSIMGVDEELDGEEN